MLKKAFLALLFFIPSLACAQIVNPGGGSGLPASPTSPNNVTQILGCAVASSTCTPAWLLPSITPRHVSGTTSTDTIVSADVGNVVVYDGSVAVATALPTPTTLGVTQSFLKLVNNTSGSATAVTVTATTLNFQTSGTTTLTIAQGQQCLLTVNPNSGTPIWDDQCNDLPLTASTNITIARGQFGPTISATGGIANMIASSSTVASTTPSGTQFLPFMGSQSGLNGTAGQSQLVAPRAGTVSNLQVRVSAAEGASATLKLTLMDGATAEAVTCTIGNSGTTCNDTTHTFAFASGDLLEWQVIQSGTGTAQFVYLTFLIQ